MLFPTIRFAVFFGVVLAVGWRLAAWPKWWKRFVLVASYVFYGAGTGASSSCIAVRTIANQAFAVRIHRAEPATAKLLLLAAVAVNLGVLGYFKYYDFFSSSLVNLLATSGWTCRRRWSQVVLPVGISFFTFQAISYVIDVYRGDDRAGARSSTSRCTWRSSRTSSPGRSCGRPNCCPQLRGASTPGASTSSRALFLIVLGLFKKVVIADYLAAYIVDKVFANPEPALGARGAVRRLRLRDPDLRRLLRLHRHRHRARAAARGSSSPRTSTRRTPRCRCRTSGAAGT